MTYNESNTILSWKRPWSLEEIVNSSQCWSLAADSGVCELLKGFSTDLLNEIAQLNNNVNELSIESGKTNVIIQNAFNDFCMLANNQFMENLVEDVGACPMVNGNVREDADAVLQNKEEKLAQVIPQVSATLQLGMQVLDRQFEILNVQRATSVSPAHDDSDNETTTANSPLEYANNDPIYHPRDPYENRHLPHLIGTTAFVEDDTLGIGFIDDIDDVQDSDSDHGGRRPSAAAATGGVSRPDEVSSVSSFESDLEEGQIRPAIHRQRAPSSSDSAGNIFDDNKSEDQSDEDMFASASANVMSGSMSRDTDGHNKPSQDAPTKALTLQDQLHDQLKRKLGLVADESSASLLISGDNIMGGDSPMLLPYNATLISPPTTSHTMPTVTTTTTTSSRNIFQHSDDDDDDMDDLFSTTRKDKLSSSVNKPAAMHSTVVADVRIRPDSHRPPGQTASVPPNIAAAQSDSDDDLFSSTVPKLPQATSTATPKGIVQRKPSPVKFLDSDSGDDDIFSVAPPRATVGKEKAATFPTKTSEPAKKLEKPPLYSLLNYDDDDDDDGLFTVPVATSKVADTPTKSLDATKIVELVPDDILVSSSTNIPSAAVIDKGADSADDILAGTAPPTTHSTQNEIYEAPPKDILQANISVDIPNATVVDKKSDSDDDSLFWGPPLTRPTDVHKPFASKTVAARANKRGNVTNSVAAKEDKEAARVDSDESGDDLFKFAKPAALVHSDIAIEDNQADSVGRLMSNSSNSCRDVTVEIDTDTPEREPAPHKLPAGAVNPFGFQSTSKMGGMSIIDEMKRRNRKSGSFNDTSDPLEVNKMEHEPVAVSTNFKERLRMSLAAPRPSAEGNVAVSTSHGSAGIDTAINLEQPPQEIRQLNLLTKSRARNIPRRRPTAKKTEGDNEDNITAIAEKELLQQIPADRSIYLINPIPPKRQLGTMQRNARIIPCCDHNSIYRFIKHHPVDHTMDTVATSYCPEVHRSTGTFHVAPGRPGRSIDPQLSAHSDANVGINNSRSIGRLATSNVISQRLPHVPGQGNKVCSGNDSRQCQLAEPANKMRHLTIDREKELSNLHIDQILDDACQCASRGHEVTDQQDVWPAIATTRSHSSGNFTTFLQQMSPFELSRCCQSHMGRKKPHKLRTGRNQKPKKFYRVPCQIHGRSPKLCPVERSHMRRLESERDILTCRHDNSRGDTLARDVPQIRHRHAMDKPGQCVVSSNSLAHLPISCSDKKSSGVVKHDLITVKYKRNYPNHHDNVFYECHRSISQGIIYWAIESAVRSCQLCYAVNNVSMAEVTSDNCGRMDAVPRGVFGGPQSISSYIGHIRCNTNTGRRCRTRSRMSETCLFINMSRIHMPVAYSICSMESLGFRWAFNRAISVLTTQAISNLVARETGDNTATSNDACPRQVHHHMASLSQMNEHHNGHLLDTSASHGHLSMVNSVVNSVVTSADGLRQGHGDPVTNIGKEGHCISIRRARRHYGLVQQQIFQLAKANVSPRPELVYNKGQLVCNKRNRLETSSHDMADNGDSESVGGAPLVINAWPPGPPIIASNSPSLYISLIHQTMLHLDLISHIICPLSTERATPHSIAVQTTLHSRQLVILTHHLSWRCQTTVARPPCQQTTLSSLSHISQPVSSMASGHYDTAVTDSRPTSRIVFGPRCGTAPLVDSAAVTQFSDITAELSSTPCDRSDSSCSLIVSAASLPHNRCGHCQYRAVMAPLASEDLGQLVQHWLHSVFIDDTIRQSSSLLTPQHLTPSVDQTALNTTFTDFGVHLLPSRQLDDVVVIRVTMDIVESLLATVVRVQDEAPSTSVCEGQWSTHPSAVDRLHTVDANIISSTCCQRRCMDTCECDLTSLDGNLDVHLSNVAVLADLYYELLRSDHRVGR